MFLCTARAVVVNIGDNRLVCVPGVSFINLSGASEGIFLLIWSVPCLMMPLLLKSPWHQ